MSQVDYGHVEITIGDEALTLTPTLDCVRKLKRWGLGSPMEAIEACRKFDADTLSIVVAAGSGKGQKQLEPLAQAIHDQGTSNVTAPVIDFLVMLLNPTGKTVDDDADSKEEDDKGE